MLEINLDTENMDVLEEAILGDIETALVEAEVLATNLLRLSASKVCKDDVLELEGHGEDPFITTTNHINMFTTKPSLAGRDVMLLEGFKSLGKKVKDASNKIGEMLANFLKAILKYISDMFKSRKAKYKAKEQEERLVELNKTFNHHRAKLWITKPSASKTLLDETIFSAFLFDNTIKTFSITSRVIAHAYRIAESMDPKGDRIVGLENSYKEEYLEFVKPIVEHKGLPETMVALGLSPKGKVHQPDYEKMNIPAPHIQLHSRKLDNLVNGLKKDFKEEEYITPEVITEFLRVVGTPDNILKEITKIEVKLDTLYEAVKEDRKNISSEDRIRELRSLGVTAPHIGKGISYLQDHCAKFSGIAFKVTSSYVILLRQLNDIHHAAKWFEAFNK